MSSSACRVNSFQLFNCSKGIISSSNYSTRIIMEILIAKHDQHAVLTVNPLAEVTAVSDSWGHLIPSSACDSSADDGRTRNCRSKHERACVGGGGAGQGSQNPGSPGDPKDIQVSWGDYGGPSGEHAKMTFEKLLGRICEMLSNVTTCENAGVCQNDVDSNTPEQRSKP